MKTPDESKKGLECCKDYQSCTEYGEPKCPYNDIRECVDTLLDDALAYIQQLEADNAQLNRCIENMTDKLNAANDEIAKMEAEIEEYEQSAIKCCYESRCNAELNELESLCKRLKDENEQLQSERDAAVEDLETVCVMCSVCHACKDRFFGGERCRGCLGSNHWEWRGVQKEE